MPKIKIEMMDDEDGMVFRMSGDPIPMGDMGTPAQLLGMAVAASVKAGIYLDLVEFVTCRIAGLDKGEGENICLTN